MKKKLMIIVPVLLLLVGAAYKMVLAPKPAVAKMKIQGSLLALNPEFVINLAGDRYAKVTVSVLTDHPPAAGHTGGAPELVQNDAVRAVITDELTGVDATELINRRKRTVLLKRLVKALHHDTDEHISRVFFTDIAVQ